jgi:hypothetical protein
MNGFVAILRLQSIINAIILKLCGAPMSHINHAPARRLLFEIPEVSTIETAEMPP